VFPFIWPKTKKFFIDSIRQQTKQQQQFPLLIGGKKSFFGIFIFSGSIFGIFLCVFNYATLLSFQSFVSEEGHFWQNVFIFTYFLRQ